MAKTFTATSIYMNPDREVTLTIEERRKRSSDTVDTILGGVFFTLLLFISVAVIAVTVMAWLSVAQMFSSSHLSDAILLSFLATALTVVGLGTIYTQVIAPLRASTHPLPNDKFADPRANEGDQLSIRWRTIPADHPLIANCVGDPRALIKRELDEIGLDALLTRLDLDPAHATHEPNS